MHDVVVLLVMYPIYSSIYPPIDDLAINTSLSGLFSFIGLRLNQTMSILFKLVEPNIYFSNCDMILSDNTETFRF